MVLNDQSKSDVPLFFLPFLSLSLSSLLLFSSVYPAFSFINSLFDYCFDTSIAINYFGAKETLEGLRPQLRGPRPRAVTICSTSVVMPFDQMTLELCLAGDEEAAKKHAAEIGGFLYGCTKRALWLWLRHAALTKEWAGSGILLNAVAPGAIMTPMTAPLLDIPEMVEALSRSNPIAVEKFAGPEDVAELLDFLLNFEGNYILGQTYFIDGGTDAIIRPDHV